jgi:hypothetical protein
MSLPRDARTGAVLVMVQQDFLKASDSGIIGPAELARRMAVAEGSDLIIAILPGLMQIQDSNREASDRRR